MEDVLVVAFVVVDVVDVVDAVLLTVVVPEDTPAAVGPKSYDVTAPVGVVSKPLEATEEPA